MFKPIPGGKKVIIKDAFDVDVVCWLPPVGYGINSITGELEKTDVLMRSPIPKEQKWQREGLPDWWERKRADEKQIQDVLDAAGNNEEHIDEECEAFRLKFWGRRLRGCWFYNNGVPTYITGTHWMLLECWKFQGIYFNFRIPNMEFFYFWDYCVEDPNCLGDIEITKRKEGKTARAGLLLYEYISRTASKHGGIQSKTDPDAAEVFQKAVINPWQKLPDFFKPLFDDIKGDNPEKELRFFNSSRKGKSSKKKIEEALESWIDFKPRGTFAYDGPELHRYVSDEAGKLKDVDIVDRHNVVQFCSEVDGEFVGKQHYTTTVEEMENGGGAFQRLVAMSDRRKLDANGRTQSGLYVYFLPAYRTLFYDDYGYPDEKKAKIYFLNKRKALENDPRSLSSFIRKNPFTLSEAFRVDGEESLYNSELLNNQLDKLLWQKHLTERGVFAWKNGERFTEVEWHPDKTGRFEICRGMKVDDPNKVINKNGHFIPGNTTKFAMGCDPFKYDKAKSKRRSNCAAFVYKKNDVADKYNAFNDAFVCKYVYRANSTGMQYEDLLMMAWHFGCTILFESNVDNWKDYFKTSKCYGFLMILPGETEPGLYSDGHGNTHQQICDVTEAYINNHIDKVYFKSLIGEGADGKGWLQFDVGDTTKFDEPMGAGYTLIGAGVKVKVRSVENTREIKNYLKKYKVKRA